MRPFRMTVRRVDVRNRGGGAADRPDRENPHGPLRGDRQLYADQERYYVEAAEKLEQEAEALVARNHRPSWTTALG